MKFYLVALLFAASSFTLHADDDIGSADFSVEAKHWIFAKRSAGFTYQSSVALCKEKGATLVGPYDLYTMDDYQVKILQKVVDAFSENKLPFENYLLWGKTGYRYFLPMHRWNKYHIFNMEIWVEKGEQIFGWKIDRVPDLVLCKR